MQNNKMSEHPIIKMMSEENTEKKQKTGSTRGACK